MQFGLGSPNCWPGVPTFGEAKRHGQTAGGIRRDGREAKHVDEIYATRTVTQPKHYVTQRDQTRTNTVDWKDTIKWGGWHAKRLLRFRAQRAKPRLVASRCTLALWAAEPQVAFAWVESRNLNADWKRCEQELREGRKFAYDRDQAKITWGQWPQYQG